MRVKPRLRWTLVVVCALVLASAAFAALRGPRPEPPLRFWCLAGENVFWCEPGILDGPGGAPVPGFEDVRPLYGGGDESPHLFGICASAIERSVRRFDEGIAYDLGCDDHVLIEADMVSVQPAPPKDGKPRSWLGFVRSVPRLPAESRVEPALAGTWAETVPGWANVRSEWRLRPDGRYVRDLSGLPHPRVERGTWAVLDDVLLFLQDGGRGTSAVALSADRRSWRGSERATAERHR